MVLGAPQIIHRSSFDAEHRIGREMTGRANGPGRTGIREKNQAGAGVSPRLYTFTSSGDAWCLIAVSQPGDY
jgi:hypothetical protein